MATMQSGLGGPAGYGENVFSLSTLTAGNLDDGSVQVDVTTVFGASGINFFGTNYTSIYINSNGLITFAAPETAYTPIDLNDYTSPAIAPFWSDVNINSGGEIYWDIDQASGTITITWLDVAPYQGTGTNSFQVILSDNGSGDLSVEFVYEDVEWTDGYRGDATVGITDGALNDFLLPGSGNAAELVDFDTDDFGNGDPNGTWEMDIYAGVADPSNGTVDGTSGDDLIDSAYDGDLQNDFVDTADGTGVERNEDIIAAGAGNDSVYAGLEDDTVFGGAGSDTIFGGSGSDELSGDSGDDTIAVSASDTAYGGGGDDLFIYDEIIGESGNVEIFGGSTGEGGSDTTNGSAGDILDLSTLYANGEILAGSLSFDPANSENGSVTLSDGTVITFEEIENFICFAKGTKIRTASGARLIEDLRAGDWIETHDNGLQEIKWIGSREVPAIGKLAPIKFAAGALLNSSDLWVSPQHRMLIAGWRAELLYGEHEVLVPAKHLVNDHTIYRDECGTVEYFHILFDGHEIIFANDAPSESFHPGEVGLSVIEDACREEIFTIFPELRNNVSAFGLSARMSLKPHESSLLTTGKDNSELS